MIDWSALMQVGVATIGATILVVAVFAMASSAISQAHDDEARRPWKGSAVALRTVGYAGFALAGLFALYGIYLIVPYLHAS